MKTLGWRAFVKRHLAVGLVLLGGFAISAATFFTVDRFERERAATAFEQAATERIFAIHQVLNANIEVMYSIGAFFDSSVEVDRQEFRSFVTPVLTRLKSFQAIEYAPLVRYPDRAAFEAKVRAEGFPDFEIREVGPNRKMIAAAERPDYYPLTFIEPFKENAVVHGYDIGANSERRRIFRKAIEGDEPVATEKFDLAQGDGTIEAVVVSHPIYKNQTPRSTPQERLDSIAGFAVGVMRVDETVEALYRAGQKDGPFRNRLGIDIYLFDRDAPPNKQLLYVRSSRIRNIPAPPLSEVEAREGLDVTREFEFAGRHWAIVGRPADTRYTIGNPWLGFGILSILLVFTMFLARYVYFATRRRELVELLVARREQELRETETRMTTIVDTVAEGIIAIDERGIVQSFNSAAETIFGISSREIVGRSVNPLIPEPDRSRHDGYLKSYLETGRKRVIGTRREVVGNRADGTEFPMEIAVSEATFAGRRLFIGIVRDITARKRNEAALLRRTSLVNLMHQITVAANDAERLDEAIRICLDMVCAYTHWPVGHVYIRRGGNEPSMESLDVWHLDAAEKYAPFREASNALHFPPGVGMPGRVMVSGEPEWLEDVVAHPDFLRAEVAEKVGLKTGFGVPVKIGADVVAVLEFFSGADVAPDNLLLQALTHVGAQVGRVMERIKIDRLKKEFVSTVSHELRTPVTSIQGALGLIRGGAVSVDKTQGLVEIAHKNSERLVRLLNDILDVEKIEAGKMDFRFQPIPVRALLDEAVAANRSYGESYGVDMAIAGETPDAVVRGDEDRLMQVMANLLSNAVKFSPKGGMVEVRATLMETEPKRVRISVADQGPGIPVEFRARMFGKFAQADATDARRLGGTGLGLSIVKLIVERHGGAVGFETELGQGTTFNVDLPLWTDNATEAAEKSKR